MVVNFNAKKVLGVLDITPELRERFEFIILSFSKQILSDVDYKNLESITVTDDFVNEVLAFQREHLNGVEGITNNQYGKALGKMIYVPSQKKYYIFLDSGYASFLIDDKIMDSIVDNLNGNQELIDNIILQRKSAINILIHELEHYRFANIQTAPILDGTLDSQCEGLMFELFDEYNAARRAAEECSTSIFLNDEEYLLNIEKYVMDNRLKYNTRKIDLNDFVALFHQYTRQSLMYIVGNIGSKYGVESNEELFRNCRCYPSIQELEKEFDKINSSIKTGGKVQISNRLIEWLKEYYELFGVYISEEVHGLYYNIPYGEGLEEI